MVEHSFEQRGDGDAGAKATGSSLMFHFRDQEETMARAVIRGVPAHEYAMRENGPLR